MAERRKVDMTPIGGKKYAKTSATPPAKSKRTTVVKEKPKVTLQEALQALKELGFSITPPTSAQDIQRHEASLAKLGLAEDNTKPKRGKADTTQPTTLTAILGTTHVIAGQVYGPGPITLPIEEQQLFNSLLHQDQLSRRAHMDTTVFTTQSRCYIIEKGSSGDKVNLFHKREVSESQFNSDAAFEANAAITAGKQDIAGGSPTTQQTQF